jgi:hypothetical protein
MDSYGHMVHTEARQPCEGHNDLLSSILTAFKLLPHIWDRKRVLFTGVYLPQKSVLLPPIESQNKPFQKHVSSYQVKRSPGCFVWAAPTLLTGAIIKNRP